MQMESGGTASGELLSETSGATSDLAEIRCQMPPEEQSIQKGGVVF